MYPKAKPDDQFQKKHLGQGMKNARSGARRNISQVRQGNADYRTFTVKEVAVGSAVLSKGKIKIIDLIIYHNEFSIHVSPHYSLLSIYLGITKLVEFRLRGFLLQNTKSFGLS